MRELAFRTISQIGIRYRDSPCRRRCRACPRAARAPAIAFPGSGSSSPPTARPRTCSRGSTTRGSLWWRSGSPRPRAPPGFGDLLRTLTIPADPANERELARAGMPGRAFYLLRPDGHIGLAGAGIESGAVARYLSERVGMGRTG